MSNKDFNLKETRGYRDRYEDLYTTFNKIPEDIKVSIVEEILPLYLKDYDGNRILVTGGEYTAKDATEITLKVCQYLWSNLRKNRDFGYSTTEEDSDCDQCGGQMLSADLYLDFNGDNQWAFQWTEGCYGGGYISKDNEDWETLLNDAPLTSEDRKDVVNKIKTMEL